MTAESFFQQFDIYKRDAGYAHGYDNLLIMLCEKQLSPRLVDEVLHMRPYPTTYADFKQAAIQMDQALRRAQDISRERRRFQPSQASAPHRPAPAPPVSRPHQLPRHDNTGTTFGGLGQPMDVVIDKAKRNNLCFLCGKAGHISRNCPGRVERMRSMMRFLSGPERREWADEFAMLKESDFEDEEENSERVDGERDFTDAQE